MINEISIRRGHQNAQLTYNKDKLRLPNLLESINQYWHFLVSFSSFTLTRHRKRAFFILHHQQDFRPLSPSVFTQTCAINSITNITKARSPEGTQFSSTHIRIFALFYKAYS